MARVSSGLQYPERFYAAAAYVGFDGSPRSSAKAIRSKFKPDTALLLYALHQQATVGPCNVPEPSAWNAIEKSKWSSWKQLGEMVSTEAMRLFVKLLEEEDPGWYSRASNFVSEPVIDVQTNHNSKSAPVVENGSSYPETKMISAENGIPVEVPEKDIVPEGLETVVVYDQWTSPPISGQRPKARYEHGAAVVQDKMYIYGGNHNGRYLNDLNVLDFRTWSWTRIEVKAGSDSPSPVTVVPCAGHSLIPWENKLLSIAGHAKDPSETIQGCSFKIMSKVPFSINLAYLFTNHQQYDTFVYGSLHSQKYDFKEASENCMKAFDLQTCSWSALKTYGKPPVSRGGQSVTLVGTSLVIFGGQDAKRTLLNDLHILDLETMTWDEIDAVGVPPSPRSDHAAAVHAERYLLIFGGGSHATCFNDLHVLDLQAMEWSRPTQQGDIPTPRAGHAGVTVGENWFIVGGGDNKSGVSETVVLNMFTLVWSVVTTVQGRVPIASEGLSVVVGSYNGEDILVSFGGYNGRYSNEVNVLKPSHKSTLQSKMMETPVPDSVSAVPNATNATRDFESELEAGQDGKTFHKDIVDSEPTRFKGEKSSEHVLASLRAEREELESSLSKEKVQSLQLKQDLEEAETRNTDLYKELQSVRGQLAAEQSRCFKLEVELAELRQKIQTMETLQKELELLQRQKAVSEQAALNAKQRQGSGGVWGWLAGTPPDQKEDEA
ncbi:hypothetical protein TIFTF001_013073 [Ficus carica]|uniref:ACB domain-containing protein n=1 Tax=Ficus carica TaxID=3494 RepID=A0AA88A2U9_FICCA|nr:hypothetical protein TIFTF001_013073 [Ficus carica]